MGRAQPRHGAWLDLGPAPYGAGTPPFDALGRWLLARTAEIAAGRQQMSAAKPEATVFTNIAPGNADVVRPWVDALRNVGFAVFAKPKVDDNSDVDADMLRHIDLRCSGRTCRPGGGFSRWPGFRRPLEAISRSGVPVQVLGFREHASWA